MEHNTELYNCNYDTFSLPFKSLNYFPEQFMIIIILKFALQGKYENFFDQGFPITAWPTNIPNAAKYSKLVEEPRGKVKFCITRVSSCIQFNRLIALKIRGFSHPVKNPEQIFSMCLRLPRYNVTLFWRTSNKLVKEGNFKERKGRLQNQVSCIHMTDYAGPRDYVENL